MKSYNSLYFNKIYICSFALIFFAQTASCLTDSDVETKKKIRSIPQWFDNLHFDYGISYRKSSCISGNYRFIYQPSGQTEILSIEKDFKSQNTWLNFFSSTIAYDLSENWDIFLHGFNYGIFTQKRICSSYADVGVRYRINIKPKLFAGGSLAIGLNEHYVYLGRLNHSLDKFDAGGTSIKSQKLDIYSGYKQVTLSPGLSLSQKIGKMWFYELELFAKYHIHLSKREAVELREKDGFFLFRKTVSLPANTVHVTHEGKDPYITVAPFQIGLMIRLL